MEQLLYGNYDGKNTAKIINKLLLYSNAKVCSSIMVKNQFNINPMEAVHVMQKVAKKVNAFYFIGILLKDVDTRFKS